MRKGLIWKPDADSPIVAGCSDKGVKEKFMCDGILVCNGEKPNRIYSAK
jgi:hypothetical protein